MSGVPPLPTSAPCLGSLLGEGAERKKGCLSVGRGPVSQRTSPRDTSGEDGPVPGGRLQATVRPDPWAHEQPQLAERGERDAWRPLHDSEGH